MRPDSNAPSLVLVKGVRELNGNDLNGRSVTPGQTIEYTLTLRNAGSAAVNNTFIAEYLPADVTYVANSVQVTAGANAGAKTDLRGDDQVDYYPTAFINGQINIFTGAGAAADKGGTLAPNESTTVVFRVTVNANAPIGAVIRNGADWGAEDFGIGGKSNIVVVTVIQCPTITLSPAAGALPAGTVGTVYSQTITQNCTLGVVYRGKVLIPRVNFNLPIPATDPRVRGALMGDYGDLAREFVAIQLTLLDSGGSLSPDVVSALASSLRCHGLDFSPVTVRNGSASLTPETKLSDLLKLVEMELKGGTDSQDRCVFIKLLNQLNGNSPTAICNRATGRFGFADCNK